MSYWKIGTQIFDKKSKWWKKNFDDFDNLGFKSDVLNSERFSGPGGANAFRNMRERVNQAKANSAHKFSEGGLVDKLSKDERYSNSQTLRRPAPAAS